MKLSVVILNYNVRYFLELCLQSVQAALKDIPSEIIVIDNHSMDDSCTMVKAKRYPNKNFIGIDIKGARFWRGAKTAIEDQMPNVAFIRTQIELIEFIFAENEVDEIWITFPDPQIKYKRTKHRLTNAEFLQRYKNVLKNTGVVHLKTDSEFMHGYTLGLLHGLGHEVEYANHDVYRQEGSPEEVTEIQTYYEETYLAKDKAITYIRFKIN